MRTHSVTFRPYWFITPSLRAIMYSVCGALSLQIIMLFFTKNFDSLLIILAAVSAALTAEMIVKITSKTSTNGILVAFLQGMITGMLLPQNYPVFSVFLLTLFSFLFVKYAFGGLSGSWINAAAFTAAVVYLTGSDFFPSVFNFSSFRNIQNPSVFFISDGNVPILAHDESIIRFFNMNIFRHIGTTVPGGFISFLWDSGSSVPAFRFNAIILLSSVFLISFNMINRIIPFFYFFSYFLLVRLFGGTAAGTGFASGDILFAMLSGGTLFTGFFLLDWFGTVPLSPAGKIFYALSAGVISFVISGCGGSSSGAVFTVLAANLLSAVIQYCESGQSGRFLNKRIIPKIRKYWRIPDEQ